MRKWKNGRKGRRRKVLTILGTTQITTWRRKMSFLLHKEDKNQSSQEKDSLGEKSREWNFDLDFRLIKGL